MGLSALAVAAISLHEQFEEMKKAGFKERQALVFLAEMTVAHQQRHQGMTPHAE